MEGPDSPPVAVGVDDSATVLAQAAFLLEEAGFEVLRAETAREAQRVCRSAGRLHVGFIDKQLPDDSGLNLIPKIKKLHPHCELIMITGTPTFESAVAAFKWGAMDFIEKPLRPDALRNLAKSAAEKVRLREDNARLEQQLARAQRMEAVGRLAGGIAHDFNNVLMAIITSAAFLREDVVEGDPRQEDIDGILKAAESASRLVRQLLVFSRDDAAPTSSNDVNGCIRRLERILRRTLPSEIDLVMQLSDDTGNIELNLSHLEQLVMNLVINARDAMPSGGELVVETRRTGVGAGAAGATILPAGEYAELRVTDSGIGMTEDVKQSIFEPFFTTKDEGKGTGLGLSTCYGIANAARGAILVDSELGRGSTFRVLLPASVAPSASRSRLPAEDERRGGSETILLVEDDNRIRRLTARILERYGYDVRTAAHGDEALEMVEGGGAEFDMILTDIDMPKINGPALIEMLSERHRPVPARYMTGYGGGESVALDNVPSSAIISKPFRAAELLTFVRKALDEDGGSSS